MSDPASTSPPTVYASLLRRVQALIWDAAIYALLFVLIVYAPEVLGLPGRAAAIVLWLLIASTLVYEPAFVAARGGTIGHFHYGLRVVDANTGRRLSFLRAFFRALVKGVLGIPSFLLMLVTRRAQSLHDLMSSSLVIVAEPAAATELDTAMPPVAIPAPAMPSALRRAVVIVSYSIAAFLVGAIAAGLLTSSRCLDANVCSSEDTLVLIGFMACWLGATAAFLAFGWRGRLPGCRAR